jgi:predicted RNase H-like nuclease
MKYCEVIFDKYVNMAERVRNSDWENDEEMRQDLEKYVQRNLRREEILDFMIAGYPMYAWSICSLSCRLQHFGIKYTDYDIELEDVKKAVKKELDGPGVLLGYRAMQQKVREVHGLNVSRDLVYAVMGEADPEGLKSRGGVAKPKRPRRMECVREWSM